MKLNEYRDKCWQIAESRGFHIEGMPFPTVVMLVITELAEAVEGHRNNDWANVEEEIADTFIRLFDLAGRFNIDIEAAVDKKMAVNEKRSHKHGKQY